MSTLTIQAFDMPNCQLAGGTAQLRIYYSQSFIASDGTPVQGGALGSDFYTVVNCTIANSTLSVPEFDLFTSNDAEAPLFSEATVTGVLYQNGAEKSTLFSQFIPSTSLGSSCDFAAWSIFNAAAVITYPPSFYLTREQVAALITEMSLLSGTLTEFRVPVANSTGQLQDGLIQDDGLNVAAQTFNYVQLGDLNPSSGGGGTRMEVNDTFGLAKLLAGADARAQYAGIIAECAPGSAAVSVQSTGQTHVYGTLEETWLGDARNDGNGVQIRIYNHDNESQMISMTARNWAPDDTQIFAEEICWFLDQTGTKLKARLRLDDGTYATWEGAYTPD